MTSNDLKTTQTITQSKKKNKNVLTAGSMQENIENDDQCLDEILDNNHKQMELAIQIIANDKTVRSDTVQDLKDLNFQSLATQSKKREQLVSIMTAIKKAFNILGDDIVELSTKHDAFKNRMGYYDEKRLQESKAKLLKQIDDDKRANLIKSRKKKQTNKQ